MYRLARLDRASNTVTISHCKPYEIIDATASYNLDPEELTEVTMFEFPMLISTIGLDTIHDRLYSLAYFLID
jgi:hypothetical protein